MSIRGKISFLFIVVSVLFSRPIFSAESAEEFVPDWEANSFMDVDALDSYFKEILTPELKKRIVADFFKKDLDFGEAINKRFDEFAKAESDETVTFTREHIRRALLQYVILKFSKAEAVAFLKLHFGDPAKELGDVTEPKQKALFEKLYERMVRLGSLQTGPHDLAGGEAFETLPQFAEFFGVQCFF